MCRAKALAPKIPVTEEWLRQKYLVEFLSSYDIAPLVNRNPKTVWSWLNRLGIPTRERGKDPHEREAKKNRPGFFKGHRHTPEACERVRKARLRDGRVPYLKDGVHWLKGKRGSETTNWKGGITPERQSFYASEEWKCAADAVKKRDGSTCQRCSKRAGLVPWPERMGAFCIHHIVSFEFKPLRADVSNLVYLCKRCHLWIHSSDNVGSLFILQAPREVNA